MKKLKLRITLLLVTASLIFGFGFTPLVVYASEPAAVTETLENDAKNGDFSEDLPAIEETPEAGEETPKNDELLGEGFGDLTIDDIKEAVKDYLEEKTDKETGKVDFLAILEDAKTWIIVAVTQVCNLFGGGIFAWVLGRLNKKKDLVSDATINKATKAAAKETVQQVVGKTINVDISAEVSKAVKKELAGIKDSLQQVSDGVKNTELLVADVAIAQSRSRLLSSAEQKQLKEDAKSVRAHSEQALTAPASIEVSVVQEEVLPEGKTLAEKNSAFINFDGVKSK